MDDQLGDMKRLAEDAARDAYDPRAKKCWPWSHQWTMWNERIVPGSGTVWQSYRKCIRCGKSQYGKVY